MSRRVLSALAMAALGACSSTVELDINGHVPELEVLDEGTLELLRGARERLEAGDMRGARDRYASLAEAHPEDPWMATLAQEARFLGLEEGSDALSVNLRRSYREAAEAEPSPLRFLLAARAEPDAYAALYLAERALELDFAYAWGHYARAHALARLGETEEGRRAVERAVALEPRNLPAWWLLAWLRSHAGEQERAIETWSAWLEVAREDPRVSQEAISSAECDLGVLLVRAKRHEEAASLLGAASRDAGGRADSVLAAATVELGELEEALASVRSARERDPDSLLYVVQEALLLERRAPNSREAVAAWREVYERSEGLTDLSALLQRARAEAHLSSIKRDSSEQGADD
ncbi:MAG: tetratricopeptide repeat protein [Planctomycetes bacterium]|nr:tetratricopeptide repeat protein [Planctomycetota bacterium]